MEPQFSRTRNRVSKIRTQVKSPASSRAAVKSPASKGGGKSEQQKHDDLVKEIEEDNRDVPFSGT